jgi:hypothetical protein
MSHLATNENPGAGTPGVEAHTKNSQLDFSAACEISQRKTGIEPARLRHLARRISRLGERALFELFRELLAGADLAARLEVYAGLDPSVLAALGGVALPAMMTAIDGGRQ